MNRADGALLALKMKRIAWDLEGLIPEVKRAVTEGQAPVISDACDSLGRVSAALRALVGAKKAMSLAGLTAAAAGARIVLSAIPRDEAPAKASLNARALAYLLERPTQEITADEMSQHLACTVATARTTLNRLVRSGHVERAAAGCFIARPSRS